MSFLHCNNIYHSDWEHLGNKSNAYCRPTIVWYISRNLYVAKLQTELVLTLDILRDIIDTALNSLAKRECFHFNCDFAWILFECPKCIAICEKIKGPIIFSLLITLQQLVLFLFSFTINPPCGWGKEKELSRIPFLLNNKFSSINTAKTSSRITSLEHQMRFQDR